MLTWAERQQRERDIRAACVRLGLRIESASGVHRIVGHGRYIVTTRLSDVHPARLEQQQLRAPHG